MGNRVAIIGSGPGGLAAAMMLAKAGKQVTVLERNDYVGGRTSIFEADGFKFDRGPTFFLYPRILKEIYEACGKDLFEKVDLVRIDPQYRLIYGDGSELVCTPDVKRMEQSIAALSPADAGNFRKFLEEHRHKFASVAPCLQRPFLGWKSLFSKDLFRLLPWIKPWSSLDRELRRFFKDERVRLAFTFQGKYLGMSPFKCPSVFSILSYLEYEHGVYHPIGGCGAVSKAMAETAEELGADIRLGCEVQEILFQGRKAVAVRTNEGVVDFDHLIINADFARAMSRLVPNHLRRRWKDQKLAKKRYSCSTFMMYLGIDGLEENIAHHSIYLPTEYEQLVGDIENRHVLPEKPAVYLQNASVTDPTLAPNGQSTLYVLVPVTHQHPNVDWNKEKIPFRAKVIKQLEKFGIKNLEERIRYEKIVTPADWESQHEVYRGATFNLSHNLGQMLHQRPQNRFEDLEEVYLVGGGTHPGSGLPVIYESARITSRLLLQQQGEDYEWLLPSQDSHLPATITQAHSEMM